MLRKRRVSRFGDMYMKRFLCRRFVFLSSVVASLVVPGIAFGNFIEFAVGGDTTTASTKGIVITSSEPPSESMIGSSNSS